MYKCTHLERGEESQVLPLCLAAAPGTCYQIQLLSRAGLSNTGTPSTGVTHYKYVDRKGYDLLVSVKHEAWTAVLSILLLSGCLLLIWYLRRYIYSNNLNIFWGKTSLLVVINQTFKCDVLLKETHLQCWGWLDWIYVFKNLWFRRLDERILVFI